MTWINRGGIQVWDDSTFPEPDDTDLTPYVFTGKPVGERMHPSCGKPGTGRNVHRKLGEAPCAVCNAAEAEYARRRREAVTESLGAAR